MGKCGYNFCFPTCRGYITPLTIGFSGPPCRILNLPPTMTRHDRLRLMPVSASLDLSKKHICTGTVVVISMFEIGYPWNPSNIPEYFSLNRSWLTFWEWLWGPNAIRFVCDWTLQSLTIINWMPIGYSLPWKIHNRNVFTDYLYIYIHIYTSFRLFCFILGILTFAKSYTCRHGKILLADLWTKSFPKNLPILLFWSWQSTLVLMIVNGC